MLAPVFTIGHSIHSQEQFIALLTQHAITALCDVRSHPYSRMNPQFNREDLKAATEKQQIKYVFLGRELGARSEDPACYLNGKISYELLAQSDLFRQGLQRVQKGLQDHRIALMCAEKEPADCHRTILVSRALAAQGLEVLHILADGAIEAHTDLLRRLAKSLHLRENEHHLFCSHEEQLAEAYRLQAARIAYEPDEAESAEPAPQKSAGR